MDTRAYLTGYMEKSADFNDMSRRVSGLKSALIEQSANKPASMLDNWGTAGRKALPELKNWWKGLSAGGKFAKVGIPAGIITALGYLALRRKEPTGFPRLAPPTNQLKGYGPPTLQGIPRNSPYYSPYAKGLNRNQPGRMPNTPPLSYFRPERPVRITDNIRSFISNQQVANQSLRRQLQQMTEKYEPNQFYVGR